MKKTRIDWRSWFALAWAGWFALLYTRMVLVERVPGVARTLAMAAGSIKTWCR